MDEDEGVEEEVVEVEREVVEVGLVLRHLKNVAKFFVDVLTIKHC